jgi:hypothetical protein
MGAIVPGRGTPLNLSRPPWLRPWGVRGLRVSLPGHRCLPEKPFPMFWHSSGATKVQIAGDTYANEHFSFFFFITTPRACGWVVQPRLSLLPECDRYLFPSPSCVVLAGAGRRVPWTRSRCGSCVACRGPGCGSLLPPERAHELAPRSPQRLPAVEWTGS